MAQYAIIQGDRNFYTNVSEQVLQDFYASSTPETLTFHDLKINPQSFLDVLLMEIRRETISFSGRKKKERQSEELLLIHDIEVLENKLADSQLEATFQTTNANLQSKKQELEQIYSYQAQGAYVRARSRYKIEGEKPTRLFCSLEKHNAVQKHIPKLIVEKNGQQKEITDQKEIEDEILLYYNDLFSYKDTTH